MENIHVLLSGGDLRSIGNSGQLINLIKNQEDFDHLIKYLNHPDRLISMRAADAIEKITLHHTDYIQKHKKLILKLTGQPLEKEIKWHLALLVPRLNLSKKELESQWKIFNTWAADKSESKIVRVNALQALYELANKYPALQKALNDIVKKIGSDNTPSLNARLRKLKLIYH